MNEYKPRFLAWATSREHEAKELRDLIEGQPADHKILKSEYLQLTGKQYRKSTVAKATKGKRK